MFVLLEHTPGPANAETPPHWDFMIEITGNGGLATWRLLENPLVHGGSIPAVPLGDHRREFLNYEGEVSGERGHVRRVDRGEAHILFIEPRSVRFELAGTRLRGQFEIKMRCADSVFCPVELRPIKEQAD